MKRSILMVFVAAFVLMAGCTKEKDETSETPAFDSKAMVSELFNAGMNGYSDGSSYKSTWPVNRAVEYYQQGVEGGTIHVLGSVTGSITIDDNTGALMSGFIQIGLTETINDYTFSSNGEIYTMNGAPYISLAATFTLQPGGVFGTASSMEMGGGVTITGPNGFSKTINILITIIINSNGTGGHVSGQIGGQGVDYTF